MSRVQLSGVSKRYGPHLALHPTEIEVEEGEFLTLLGPSGCGKTTLLRIVAGFVEPTTGTVSFDGEDVTDLGPNRRSVGMVFQDYALFPHLSVDENIAFGLRERRWAKAAITRRVQELLDLIQLPEIADRLPTEISGGQQQRVAFARAIAHPPRVLLMDEPLAALDLKLREQMQGELRRLQRDLGITTIFVTHDQGEAMSLSDRIAVMSGGRVLQIGNARAIYDAPVSRFVAEFIGQINVLPVGSVAQGEARLCIDDRSIRVPASPISAARDLVLAIRPEHLAIANGAGVPDGHNRLEARVVAKVFGGNLVRVHLDAADTRLIVETRPSDHEVHEGQSVTVHWSPDRSVLFEG